MILKILDQQNSGHYKCLLLNLVERGMMSEVDLLEEKKKNVIQAMFALDLNFSEHLGR